MFLDDRRASSKARPDSLSGLHSGDEPRDVHRVHLSGTKSARDEGASRGRARRVLRGASRTGANRRSRLDPGAKR